MMSVNQRTMNENAMDRPERTGPMSSDCQKPFKSVLVSSELESATSDSKNSDAYGVDKPVLQV